ncbi:MAG TPA: DUF6305 family protein [Spirochaetia bacterium]|nr:DUF6305 family protein [Spirochaetia bacterium]
MRYGKYVLLLLAVILALVSYSRPAFEAARSDQALKASIARQPVLVTTAGQGTEGLIVASMFYRLDLSYSYLFQATPEDLAGENSLVLVLGASPAGMQDISTSPGEEERRVLRLAKEAVSQHIPVIIVHLGGTDRRGGLNDRLIRELVPLASYVLVAGDGNYDGLFSRLTAAKHIPLTEVADFDALEAPLNFAFH